MSEQSRASIDAVHAEHASARGDVQPGCSQAHLDNVQKAWGPGKRRRAPQHPDELGAYCVVEWDGGCPRCDGRGCGLCAGRMVFFWDASSKRAGTADARYRFVKLPPFKAGSTPALFVE
jgi:hypothetical protein